MAWVSRFTQIADGVPGAIDRGVFRAATYVKDLAVELAPKKTGDLKASGHLEPASADGGGEYQVIFDVPYANAVEYGRSDEPNYPAQPFLGPAKKAIKVRKEVAAEMRALLKGTR